MSRIEALMQEAHDAPDALLDGTLDFLRFLKSRHHEGMRTERIETMLLIEAALAEDWLRPEEDETCRDL